MCQLFLPILSHAAPLALAINTACTQRRWAKNSLAKLKCWVNVIHIEFQDTRFYFSIT